MCLSVGLCGEGSGLFIFFGFSLELLDVSRCMFAMPQDGR